GMSPRKALSITWSPANSFCERHLLACWQSLLPVLLWCYAACLCMTHRIDVARDPKFPEAGSRRVAELADSIRTNLEIGSVADLAHALQSVTEIAEIPPHLRDSIRLRLADTEFFGRPPTPPINQNF